MISIIVNEYADNMYTQHRFILVWYKSHGILSLNKYFLTKLNDKLFPNFIGERLRLSMQSVLSLQYWNLDNLYFHMYNLYSKHNDHNLRHRIRVPKKYVRACKYLYNYIIMVFVLYWNEIHRVHAYCFIVFVLCYVQPQITFIQLLVASYLTQYCS